MTAAIDKNFFVISAPWDQAYLISYHISHVGYSLSFLAAVCILAESSVHRRRHYYYYYYYWTSASRILVGEVVAALLVVVGCLPGTLPLPSASGVYGAAGNQTTCNVQGFLVFAGLMAYAAYDCALSLIFLLQIRCNWRERSLRRVEYFFHTVAISLTLVVSIGAMITDSYSTAGGFACFPRQESWHCAYPDILANDPEMAAFCKHAKWGTMWTSMLSGTQVATFPCSLLSMILISCRVFRQEQRNNDRFVKSCSTDDLMDVENNNNNININNNNKEVVVSRKSRKVMIGSLLYIASTFIVQLPISIQNVLLNRRQLWNWDWFAAIVAFNSHFVLVYLVIFLRQHNAQTTYGKVVQQVVSLVLCCGCVVPAPGRSDDENEETSPVSKFDTSQFNSMPFEAHRSTEILSKSMNSTTTAVPDKGSNDEEESKEESAPVV